MQFRAMGTRCEVVAHLRLTDQESRDPLAQVPVWFEQWEQALSRFRLDSELTRLNSSHAPKEVGPVLWQVYQCALQAHEASSGLINPLILNPLVEAGYDRSIEHLTLSALGSTMPGAAFAPTQLATPVPHPATICVDEDRHILCVPEEMGLDFGGVAKGWAAQQTVQRLQHLGPVMVNAGGDVAMSEPIAPEKEWEVRVDDPFRDGEYLVTLYVRAGGVATSGKDRRRWMHNGAMAHHLIDARTGMPAGTDILTATVVAPDALRAEALAKTAFLLGSDEALTMLDLDKATAGLLVLDDGRVLKSRQLDLYL